LITDLDEARRKDLFEAVHRDWEIAETSEASLEPEGEAVPVEIGYLDTAVLEALVLKGALGMSEDDISHLHGLDYSRTTDEAKAKILSGEVKAGFFMGAVPVSRVQAIAAAGEVMPPKSTYFYPKVLTGLLFNPLDEG
jgi:uncharacterized protein (DUF1015 family)